MLIIFKYAILLCWFVPVISTRCGGPEEYVINNKTGFIVDFNEYFMADAILKLINNRELRNVFSQNSRDFVVSNYSQRSFEYIFIRNLKITFPNLL